MKFPPGFSFGAATAAIQIEGAADARGESIWDRFCRLPGRVADGSNADVACDHYHRYLEDLDLIASLGLMSYRFSISWPRVLPDGRGKPSQQGIDFYRRLVDGLRERDVEPVATLYHWDLPQTLQDRGGWPARETAERFADYAALVYGALGEGVGRWITHNEPWVTAFLGHAFGTKAPGRRSWPEALRAAHHVLLSHGLAVRALRAVRGPEAQAGITLDLWPVYAASEDGEDVAAAARWDGARNRWFLDPVFRGAYPHDMVEWYEARLGPLDFVREDDLDVVATPADFLGVNYYSRTVVRSDPEAKPLALAEEAPTPPTTGMGWEVTPEALCEVLVRIRREYGDLPILITENGSAYDDPVPSDGVVSDPDRLAYLRDHLASIGRAIAAGVDVRGYFAWSLLDNFEWEHGYAKRFGIVYVDYATQRRIPKQSALWYRDFIAAQRGT